MLQVPFCYDRIRLNTMTDAHPTAHSSHTIHVRHVQPSDQQTPMLASVTTDANHTETSAISKQSRTK